jgi:hypothetical protein
LLGALLALGACRAILGIDDSRPLLDDDAGGDDGGTIVGDASDGEASLPFCANLSPPATFCADFDEPGDFRAGFYNAGKTPDPGQSGGGILQPSDDPSLPVNYFRSPPRSASFTLPALLSHGSNASAFMTAQLPTPLRYAVITVDLRIDTEQYVPDGGAKSEVLGLTFDQQVLVTIIRAEDGLRMDVSPDAQTVVKAPFTTTLPVGTWKTLQLLVHNYPVGDDGSGEVIAILDGPAASLPLPASTQGATAINLDLGFTAAFGPMGTMRLNADNLAVTYYSGP